MKELIENSVFIGVLLSLGSYAIGMWLKKKTGLAIANPLLVSIILVIGFILATGTDYRVYQANVSVITYLLTPATVCLAIPLYEQFEELKRNYKAVLAGVISGVLSSMLCILLLSLCFRFSHAEYITFLPKSITTAMGIGVSEELGGIVPLTVVVIVITGVMGNIFAEQFLKLIKIKEPIARGLAIGAASHAVGTAKAMELGQLEGAMSSLAIVVCGLLTVILAPLFGMAI